jgi:CotH kinase protein
VQQTGTTLFPPRGVERAGDADERFSFAANSRRISSVQLRGPVLHRSTHRLAVAARVRRAARASGRRATRVDIDVGPVADGPPRSARMRIRGPGGYRGHRIELRGSSSLRFDKKFYALELRSRRLKIRNAGRSVRDARSDRTFSRDAPAYATARRLGSWAPRTSHVELYLTHRYHGLYVISEHVKLDAARVAVHVQGSAAATSSKGRRHRSRTGFEAGATAVLRPQRSRAAQAAEKRRGRLDNQLRPSGQSVGRRAERHLSEACRRGSGDRLPVAAGPIHQH